MKYNSWYFNRDLKPQGPVSTLEMREYIMKGHIGPRDLISAREDGRWMMAEEWGVFEKTLFPAGQQFVPGGDICLQTKEWVLLAQDADKRLLQEGPFSLADLQAGLRQKKISPEQYVWKTGLTGWSRIADRPEFN